MTSLEDIALKLVENGPHKQEKTPRRVRGLLGDGYIFDTTEASWVWEHPYYPQFYIPKTAIRAEKFTQQQAVDSQSSVHFFLISNGGKANDRVLGFDKGPLAGLVRIEFGALDAWFEEDERTYGHPKDPYKRIDTLPSSRKVTAKVDGVTIAESSNNIFLFETMLRPRYYMPLTSAEWRYLTPSDTRTLCPYKGQAEYYNVNVNGKEHKDVVWWYRYPTAESALIAGHLCFYNEKVEILVDGERES